MSKNCTYYYGDYDDCDGSNDWLIWGRWVVLAAVIVAVLLLYFVFSCISARRRRKAGNTPFRGTAWTLNVAPPPYQRHDQGAASGPPPAYNNTQRTGDVELGQPKPAVTVQRE